MRDNILILLVRPAGFEPATYGFEVRRSIQLSYGRREMKIVVGRAMGLEPMTAGATTLNSAN